MAATILKHYTIQDLRPEDRTWIDRTALKNPAIEALAKPLRDGYLTDLYIARQYRSDGDVRRVAVSGTRRLNRSSEQLAQTPLYDSGQAPHEQIFKLRSTQLADAWRRSPTLMLESFTSARSSGDIKAHQSLSFNQRKEIRGEDFGDYVELTQGWRFIPWIRSPDASIRIEHHTMRDRLMRMVEDMAAILNGVEIVRSESWQVRLPNLRSELAQAKLINRK